MSELTPRAGTVWRAVEAQHRISTMKLVDDADEQATLEHILDTTKPPVPPECQHLHYLLFTPFRYEARADSRFRRQGATPPVFYAAEVVDTAMAEFAFWRLLFFAESPTTPWPVNPLEVTCFAVAFETARCLDASDDMALAHPTDYAPSLAFADRARALEAEAIRVPSARADGINLNLFTCAAFAEDAPRRIDTWRLQLSAAGPFARTDGRALSFGRGDFANDPRIAALDWDRR